MNCNRKRKLFIIGNGFDLAHSLPTKYSDFKKFLEDKYACKRMLHRLAPDVFTFNDGEPVVKNKDLLANLLYNLIEDVVLGYNNLTLSEILKYKDLDRSELLKKHRNLKRSELFKIYKNLERNELIEENEDLNWRKFEEHLGQISLKNVYNDNRFIQIDENGDLDYSKLDLNAKILSSNLITIIPMISDLFKEWIETVDVYTAAPKKDFIELIDKENDIFLCFNYIETLELVYGCKNVFHIHGVVGDYELVIGHNVVERSFDGEFDESYVTDHKHDAEVNIHETLRKPVEKIIKDNKTFFYDLDDISEIYSYGFGFGSVDLPYIKEILRKTNKPDTIFWLNNYDSEEADKQEKILFETLGFKGTIKRFTCNE